MENEKSTVYKGNQLEKEFAEFMKEQLGYEKYRLQKRVKGSINSKGTDVDIIAQKASAKGRRFKKITIYYYLISLFVFCIGSVLLALDNIGAGTFFLTLGIGGFASTIFFLVQSKRHDIEHGWVECKNHKTKIDLPKIDKMLREYNDCASMGEIETRNCIKYFVSASGFMENALKFAIKQGIMCYEKNKEGEFVKSEYWT
jgi:hypothetical protein